MPNGVWVTGDVSVNKTDFLVIFLPYPLYSLTTFLYLTSTLTCYFSSHPKLSKELVTLTASTSSLHIKTPTHCCLHTHPQLHLNCSSSSHHDFIISKPNRLDLSTTSDAANGSPLSKTSNSFVSMTSLLALLFPLLFLCLLLKCW